MALNKAMVIGHLGQKPELRYIPTSGAAVTGFSVATNDVFLDKQGQKQERVDWHNIVVFGKLAETCAKYLDKGREVYVEGRMRTRAWEPSDGGSKQIAPRSLHSACNSSVPVAPTFPKVTSSHQMGRLTKTSRSEWFERN
jgi:single stranded DNA-binding protein